MALNDNTPKRRSVSGSHSTPKGGSGSAARSGAGSSGATRRSTSSRRDDTPQYRSRSKAAAKKAASAPASRSAAKPAAARPSGRSAAKAPEQPKKKAAPRAAAAAKQAAPKRSAKQPARPAASAKKAAPSAASRPKGPAQRTSSNGEAFAGFFRRNLKVCLPITIALVLVVVGGVFDVASSFGKIHPGVTVHGVNVGGMSKEDAAQLLSEQLSTPLDDARVTIYTSEDNAAQDGAALLPQDEAAQAGGIEKAQAAELAATDMDGDGSSDKWTVSMETVGAYPDGNAMAEEAYLVGREGNFILERLGAWLGKRDCAPLLGFSTDLMNSLCDEIDDSCGKEVVDSKISVSAGVGSVVEGSDGWLINRERLGALITRAVYGGQATALLAPMETVPMRIQPATAQRVADQVTAALVDDITITYEDDEWVLDEFKLGDMLSQVVLEPGKYLAIGNGTQKKTEIPSKEADPEFQLPYDTSAGLDKASGYTLQCYVNQKTVDAFLVEVLGSKATGNAKNARFDTSDGETVKIVKSKNGKGPDRNAAALQLQNMLFGNDDGTLIAMEDTVIKPARTTEDAEAMGIRERLASWSIPLSGTSARITNIKLLCKLIDGSIVAPGATWSFNETTGERTAEKGFKAAPVIVNGKHEDQLGGGVCQVATCVFNAACYSGLGIVTRTNHDFYIPSYDDEGFADATVSWDVPDLEWLNDTENYILLTADASGEDVVVSLWGTDDGRKVTCERGPWKAGAKYKTIKEKDDTLAYGTTVVEQNGVDGRSIQIRYYVVSKGGEVLHDITFNSYYIAQNEIIRVGTKGAPKEDEASTSKKKKSTEAE
ncbi:MAG: VanW family protein [Coriobacteriales bacterium]